MDPLHFPEDLLGDLAVGGVPLPAGAQLHEVMDLAQIPREQDAFPEGEGKDVLGLAGEIPGDGLVGRPAPASCTRRRR